MARPGEDVLGELDTVGVARWGRAANELSINEVCDASEKYTDRSPKCRQVEKMKRGKLVAATEEDTCDDDPDNSSVACHAPFVDRKGTPERKCRTKRGEQLRGVEDAVTESTTDDGPKGDRKNKISGELWSDRGKPPSSEPTDEEIAAIKANEVSESVPPNSKGGADLNGEGIEGQEVGVVGEHNIGNCVCGPTVATLRPRGNSISGVSTIWQGWWFHRGRDNRFNLLSRRAVAYRLLISEEEQAGRCPCLIFEP